MLFKKIFKDENGLDLPPVMISDDDIFLPEDLLAGANFIVFVFNIIMGSDVKKYVVSDDLCERYWSLKLIEKELPSMVSGLEILKKNCEIERAKYRSENHAA